MSSFFFLLPIFLMGHTHERSGDKTRKGLVFCNVDDVWRQESWFVEASQKNEAACSVNRAVATSNVWSRSPFQSPCIVESHLLRFCTHWVWGLRHSYGSHTFSGSAKTLSVAWLAIVATSTMATFAALRPVASLVQRGVRSHPEAQSTSIQKLCSSWETAVCRKFLAIIFSYQQYLL